MPFFIKNNKLVLHQTPTNGIILASTPCPACMTLKLTFSCFDGLTGDSLAIDNFYINNKKIVNFSMQDDNNRKIYTMVIPCLTQFNLMIEKENYIPFTIRQSFLPASLTYPEYTYSLGRLPLLPVGARQLNSTVMVWGAQPSDLDSHMVVLDKNFNEIGHCMYNNQNLELTDTSKVILDIDDTDAYGPETITIEQPNPEYYYLYYIEDFDGEGRCNYNNETAACFLVGNSLQTIKPKMITNQYTNYQYWNVYIRHNNKLYILNELLEDDSTIRTNIETKISQATIVYEL